MEEWVQLSGELVPWGRAVPTLLVGLLSMKTMLSNSDRQVHEIKGKHFRDKKYFGKLVLCEH